MNERNLDQLVEKYLSSAKGYGDAIKAGDVKKSDRYFDLVEEAFVELRAVGKKGLETIASFLDSYDEGVRLWASAHLLNYPEFKSVSVLERLRNSPSILALTAEVTLDQWKQGKITY